MSRTERSGRYGGNNQGRGERRERGDQEREHAMRRWGEERRIERYDGGEHRGNRASPEVCVPSQTPSDMTWLGSAAKTNLIDD